jgi:hypothetical protein
MKWMVMMMVLAVASAARAQEAEGRLDRAALSVYATGAALDLHSTYLVLQRGGHEVNPLGHWIEGTPVLFLGFAVAEDVAALAGLRRWVSPKHPRAARVLLYALAGVRFACAAHNYREARNQLRLNAEAGLLR